METASAWILASLCLLTIGMALYVLKGPEDSKLAGVLTAMGAAYFGIGAVLILMHDRHMAKRTRAGRELFVFIPASSATTHHLHSSCLANARSSLAIVREKFPMIKRQASG
jgi:hypothetical protein